MKKVALLVLIGLVVAAIVFLSRFSEKLAKNESYGQSEKKESQTMVAENYSPISAIARAKALSKEKSFSDEAYQLFGIQLWSSQEDTYLQFRERLFTNSQLNSALQNAKKEKVGIFFGKEFEVQTGYVYISVSATDEEIIEFLNKSVPVAKAKQTDFESLKKEASQYGLTLFFSNDGEYYKQIQNRLVANKNLVSALQVAEKAELMVYPSFEFKIDKGYLSINVNATDEEIVEFLLGE